MTGLAIAGLACIRGNRLLFEGFDLALGAGEAAIITGPNGAGKSSLLRIIAGLLAQAAGTIERHGPIALTDENAALDRTATLARALLFWAQLDGRDANAVSAALEAMDLVQLGDIPVRMLSTGQRRRAAMARVIASGASIWLLDEPANGLDAASITRLESAIGEHRQAGGIVIVASHQPLALPGAVAIALGAAA